MKIYQGLAASVLAIVVGQAQATPFFKVFNDGEFEYLGPNLSKEDPFKSENTSLGTTLGKVDFEVLPDGSPPGNLAGAGYGNAVTFHYQVPTDVTLHTTTSNILYPGNTRIEGGYGVAVSPTYTDPIAVAFASPVAASGIWLLDIDNFTSGPDAFATWDFIDGSAYTVLFDTSSARPKNWFFSLISYTDASFTQASNDIVGFTFGELGGNATYADNLYVGMLGGSLSEYPPVLPPPPPPPPPPCDTCGTPPPPTQVAEPASTALFCAGVAALSIARRRKPF